MQVNFNINVMSKKLLPSPGFEPTTFQHMSSCLKVAQIFKHM